MELMGVSGQWLGENVRWVLLCGNPFHICFAFCDLVSQVVMTDGEMLHSSTVRV